MPRFSRRSLSVLGTVHSDLQHLFACVVLCHDCSILPDGGLRTPEQQLKLYQAGASKTLDSYHLTGRAVDVAPWPIDWDDIESFKAFAVYVKEMAETLGTDIGWGGDWADFQPQGKEKGPDYCHWQLPRNG